MANNHGWNYLDNTQLNGSSGTWGSVANGSAYGGSYTSSKTIASAWYSIYYATRATWIGPLSTNGQNTAYCNGFIDNISTNTRISSAACNFYTSGTTTWNNSIYSYTRNGALNMRVGMEHTISNTKYIYADELIYYVPPLEASTDYPNGQTIGGTFTASGWILDVSGIQYMDIYIDGVNRGRATINQSRSDILAAYPEHGISNAGWSFSYDSWNLANGTHSIYFNIVDGSGTSHNNLGSRTFYTSNTNYAPGANTITSNISSTLANNVTISYGGSDANGDNIRFKGFINGVDQGWSGWYAQPQSGLQWTIPYTSFNSGSNSVYIQVQESRGSLTTNTNTLYITRTIPNCTSITTSCGSLCYTPTFYVYANGPNNCNTVKFATWTTTNGQDDIVYHQGLYDVINNRWYYQIKVSEHNNEKGNYNIYAYGYDINNVGTMMYSYVVDVKDPPVYVNVNGTWKTGTIYVNVSGTWKAISKIYSNINGIWK